MIEEITPDPWEAITGHIGDGKGSRESISKVIDSLDLVRRRLILRCLTGEYRKDYLREVGADTRYLGIIRELIEKTEKPQTVGHFDEKLEEIRRQRW